jgi:hypothetical protein
VLRCRQQRLLRRVGIDEAGIRSVARAAAAAEAGHRLHEPIVRGVGGCARGSRRTGGEAAELPVQSDLAEAGGSGELIVGDVVDLERAGVDVAQHEIGGAGGVNWRNAGILPIQTDGADEGGAGELVVVDVVHFQPAVIGVAQQEIGFAGNAAEIADAGELPIEPDGADEGCAGDLVVGDVVDLQSAVVDVA